MIVAFGTSTPTSITVVATSTSSSPALKRAIVARRSAGRSWPCMQPTRKPRSSCALQPLGLLLRGACERRLGGSDERADDVRLSAGVEVAPEPRVGLRSSARR